MKIMVTGAKGQLGTDLCKVLKEKHFDVIETDKDILDIKNELAVKNFIENTCPDAIIHLAAYTAVDKAEEDIDTCTNINVNGTQNLAKICGEKGIKFLYTSTDYVFGGMGDEYLETDAPTCPCNVYGKTKLAGEEIVKKYCDKYFIVRISWVFGVNGSNFVYTMLRLAETKDQLNVVCDQVGSPTFTPHLSVLLADMITTSKYGVYHATNENVCSWAEFAAEIMKLAGKCTKINPILTKDYPCAAQRPLNSRLSKNSLDKASFSRLPTWQEALKEFLKDSGNLAT